jgi:magnesium-protoporphyrin O-methyltransferase
MQKNSYTQKRGQLEEYFDRTAVDAWAKLTSTAKVSGIRAKVRAGREEMRHLLLSYLPTDLSGQRVLDAGCGTGVLAADLARRGAHVVAIDLSPTLVDLARERIGNDFGAGSIEFRSGDMLDPALGEFDHVVCMDSMIHYHHLDIAEAMSKLAARTRANIAFTFAPNNAALSTLLTLGSVFPRSDRSPFIQPISMESLTRTFSNHDGLAEWMPTNTKKVQRAFYFSQAMLLSKQQSQSSKAGHSSR